MSAAYESQRLADYVADYRIACDRLDVIMPELWNSAFKQIQVRQTTRIYAAQRLVVAMRNHRNWRDKANEVDLTNTDSVLAFANEVAEAFK